MKLNARVWDWSGEYKICEWRRMKRRRKMWKTVTQVTHPNRMKFNFTYAKKFNLQLKKKNCSFSSLLRSSFRLSRCIHWFSCVCELFFAFSSVCNFFLSPLVARLFVYVCLSACLPFHTLRVQKFFFVMFGIQNCNESNLISMHWALSLMKMFFFLYFLFVLQF